MQRNTFSSLLNVIRPDLERDGKMALRSSGGRIEPEKRHALTLRLLAGASYLDIMMLFGISRSSCCAVCHETVDRILGRLHHPGLPFDGLRNIQTISREFTESRIPINHVVGCVGAADGIAVKIAKPRDCFVPRNYYCRKVFYSVPFQAIVDGRYRFLALSSVVCGSMHDSLAFRASSVWQKLYETGLPCGYWVAGDAAYVCSESVLVPFFTVQLQREDEGVWRDSFNFFQSKLRLHVEQKFGMFVDRFDILWRPLEFYLSRTSRIVSVCALLHNYIADNYRAADTDDENSQLSEAICSSGVYKIMERVTAPQSCFWFGIRYSLRSGAQQITEHTSG
jgi:DDE superfamily endonuclease